MTYLYQNTKDEKGAVEGRSTQSHRLRLIDSGMSSLEQQLALIRSAKKSIELEFFIFDIDLASRLVTEALIEQADKGIQVRLLVDFSAQVFQFKPIYSHLLKQHGIEVRYYNTSALYRIVSSQHRSHRKLLIIDGTQMITGGRNIANDYFDLGEHYNFLDSDLFIDGPIVASALRSFDLYWNSDLSEVSPETNEGAEAAASKLRVTEVDRKAVRSEIPSPIVECRDISFVTDVPGRNATARRVFPAIVKVLSEAKSNVYAESIMATPLLASSTKARLNRFGAFLRIVRLARSPGSRLLCPSPTYSISFYRPNRTIFCSS